MSEKSQLELVANYIMSSVPGEPSQDVGAGECAVYLLKRYRTALAGVMSELGAPRAGYPVAVVNAHRIAEEALGKDE